MDFRDGDLAYRVNFATADWPEIVDRRVGRDLTSEESHALAAEVNEKLVLPGATLRRCRPRSSTGVRSSSARTTGRRSRPR